MFIYLFGCVRFDCGTWGLSLQLMGSVVVAYRFSCPMARGILVPRPGIEPTSPALQGGVLTTRPPRKPQLFQLFLHYGFSPVICDLRHFGDPSKESGIGSLFSFGLVVYFIVVCTWIVIARFS